MDLSGESMTFYLDEDSRTITNFGGNITFTPQHYYQPQSEADVLTILNKHAKDKIRVIASLHSWSAVVQSEDVVVDMRHFQQVTVKQDRSGKYWATVGGGCVLKCLLNELERMNPALTLPSLGGITEQTMAGVISTGTHGSGSQSLSHFMEEVTVAAYDPDTRAAKIFTWNSGPELQAARCGLGCMGIILSVRFQCVPQYNMAEIIVRKDSIESALAQEDEFPQQQILLVPYLWTYFAYQRRQVTPEENYQWLVTPFNVFRRFSRRFFELVVVDVLFHGLVKTVVNHVNKPQVVKVIYERLFPTSIGLVENRRIIDRSEEILTLEHELYQHLEMELFIPAQYIRAAMPFLQHITSAFADADAALPKEVESGLQQIGMLNTLLAQVGTYIHHYPILVRKVLPDDTLISMTSSANESYYSVSFFTYLQPDKRAKFYDFAEFLARSSRRLYDARLHWGKYYPLKNPEIESLYPNLPQFRQICKRTDPNGVFHNEYTEQVLGF